MRIRCRFVYINLEHIEYIDMQNKELNDYLLTKEEIALIETVRKVLWGSVEVSIRNGEIKVIKKITETKVFNNDGE